jgi:hypothetical protein
MPTRVPDIMKGIIFWKVLIWWEISLEYMTGTHWIYCISHFQGPNARISVCCTLPLFTFTKFLRVSQESTQFTIFSSYIYLTNCCTPEMVAVGCELWNIQRPNTRHWSVQIQQVHVAACRDNHQRVPLANSWP